MTNRRSSVTISVEAWGALAKLATALGLTRDQVIETMAILAVGRLGDAESKKKMLVDEILGGKK